MSNQLSPELKMMLATLVRDYKFDLFNKFNPTITNRKKHDTWTDIFNELTLNGAMIKDVDNLKKVKIKKLHHGFQNQLSC
jgi:hypothetical protein